MAGPRAGNVPAQLGEIESASPADSTWQVTTVRACCLPGYSGSVPDETIDLSDLHDVQGETEQLSEIRGGVRRVRRFRLVGLEGGFTGKQWSSVGDGCEIGSHPSNDIVLDDGSVSRFHCELHVDASGVRIRDRGSRNGTLVDAMRIGEAWLRPGSTIRIGRSALRFELGGETNKLPISERTSFGSLLGVSMAMRRTFTLLERAAASDSTVLLEGETGTGKEGAAQSLHEASARKNAPFLVIDCSAIPGNLLESELFGHERGAFTGAVTRRLGVFEEAQGGTVFLDEIGELTADLQPKLLRVLEAREVRRIGASAAQPIDVRVVAATNRDLRTEVNAGRFRSDLYFRLAVIKIALPPLRERPEDVPVLVEKFVAALGRAPDPELLTPKFLDELAHAAWPGNVRELRNHLERCIVLREALPLADDADEPSERAGYDATIGYAEARRRGIEAFERGYLAALLRHHDGNVARAAEASGMNRVYLYRLLHRHRLLR
jgi:DNA-binding NtrC family response regulator